MSALLTLATLVAFAANSLFCRMALATGAIDPVGFTAIRIGSGALVLVALARRWSRGGRGTLDAGSWGSAAALFVYALGFSLAYVSLDTGVGALVLFGAVQATMIGLAILAGERPRAMEWLGIAVALGGLAYLVRPGVRAPDPVGVALMIASGIGWGIYSVRGRVSPTPVEATAGNFLRAVPMVALGAAFGWTSLHMNLRGVVLAIV
ncbi:MAG: EamA family transporter, partial [Polyangiales bacterium]